jgi:hypothetical protein
MIDQLSQLAHDIVKAATYDKLVVSDGTPAKAHELLDNVTAVQLLSVPIKSAGQGYAMMAGLWLWHDALDEAHKIAQMDATALRRSAPFPHQTPSKMSLKVGFIENVENDKELEMQELATAANNLAFWHAIMHRREGDFSNAKYWYARIGRHPVLDVLAHNAGSVVNQAPADNRLLRIVSGGWNPDALVDLVESVESNPADPQRNIAIQLQRLEWNQLFSYCARG